MKKILLFTLLLFAAVCAQAQKTVEVATAGTLSTLITNEEKASLKQLVVKGNINGDDLQFLAEMAGRNTPSKPVTGVLEELDLKDANICTGGYYQNIFGGKFQVQDNVVGRNMFSKLEHIKTLVLPATVIKIDKSSITDNPSLQSLTLGNGVKEIAGFSLSSNTKLTSVTLPAAVETLDVSAFSRDSALVAINADAANQAFASANGILFDKGMTTIVKYPQALAGAYTFPASVATIGKSAFDGAYKLTAVELSQAITSLPNYAFSGCSSLASVVLGNQLKSMGDFAFADCVIPSIELPEGLETIGACAFRNCQNLTTLALPASLKSISSDAVDASSNFTTFTVADGNENFTAVNGVLFNKDITTVLIYPKGLAGAYTLPTTVTLVDGYAFAESQKLTSITLPASVKELKALVFYGCDALTEIHSQSPVPPTITDYYTFSGFSTDGVTLYVPTGSKEAYAQAGDWGGFNIVEEQVSGINSVETEPTSAAVSAVYGIDGRVRNGIAKGINIVKMTNGTTRKIIVK